MPITARGRRRLAHEIITARRGNHRPLVDHAMFRLMPLPGTAWYRKHVDEPADRIRLQARAARAQHTHSRIVREQLDADVHKLEFYLRIQPEDRLAAAVLALALLARNDQRAVVATLTVLEALRIPHTARTTRTEGEAL